MRRGPVAGTILGTTLVASAVWLWSRDSAPEPSRAGTVAIVSVPTASPPPPPIARAPVPRLERINADPLADEPDLLFMKVRGEARDDAWAKQAEATIASMLRTVRHVGNGRPLKVTCGASICEASGTAASNQAMNDVEEAWVDLAAAVRQPTITAAGLAPAGERYGSGRDITKFTIYFRRLNS